MPNVSAFRVVRVLRPLRSLTIVPGMRVLVMSLLRSIPALMEVMVLLLFVFAIFGILALQLWAGLLHARCRITQAPIRMASEPNGFPEICSDPTIECFNMLMTNASGIAAVTNATAALDDGRTSSAIQHLRDVSLRWEPSMQMFVAAQFNSTGMLPCLDNPVATVDSSSWVDLEQSPWFTKRKCFWPIDATDLRICSLTTWGEHNCPSGRWCGSNWDSPGNARFADPELQARGTYIPSLMYGLVNFDQILVSVLTIFQSITMEGWTDVMYMVMDAYQGVVAGVYFVVLIMFGSFFLLNLLLAVIWEQFSESQKQDEEERDARMKKRQQDEIDHLRKLGRDRERQMGKQSFVANGESSADAKTAPAETSSPVRMEALTSHPAEGSSVPGYTPSDPKIPSPRRLSQEAAGAAAAGDAPPPKHRIRQVVPLNSVPEDGEAPPDRLRDAQASSGLPESNVMTITSGSQLLPEQSMRAEAADSRALTPTPAEEGGPEEGGPSPPLGGLSSPKSDDERMSRIARLQDRVKRGELTMGQMEGELQRLKSVEDVMAMPPWRRWFFRLATSPMLNFVVMMLIILNTGVLAGDHYGMAESTATALDIVNFILTILFAMEMAVKMIGLGLRRYARDPFNAFDAVIVLTTLVELAALPPAFLTPSQEDLSSAGGGISALRTFRLFRVFALAKHWTSLRVLLRTIVKTLKDVANFAVLLLIFMYMFSLIGMQFFANQLCFDPDSGDPAVGLQGTGKCPAPFVRPRSHFDDLLRAFITVFQVLTGENWNTVMYDCWLAVGWGATLYFVALVVIGNFVILNLFLAILLGNFEGMEELVSTATADATASSSRGGAISKMLSRIQRVISPGGPARVQDMPDDSGDDVMSPMGSGNVSGLTPLGKSPTPSSQGHVDMVADRLVRHPYLQAKVSAQIATDAPGASAGSAPSKRLGNPAGTPPPPPPLPPGQRRKRLSGSASVQGVPLPAVAAGEGGPPQSVGPAVAEEGARRASSASPTLQRSSRNLGGGAEEGASNPPGEGGGAMSRAAADKVIDQAAGDDAPLGFAGSAPQMEDFADLPASRFIGASDTQPLPMTSPTLSKKPARKVEFKPAADNVSISPTPGGRAMSSSPLTSDTIGRLRTSGLVTAGPSIQNDITMIRDLKRKKRIYGHALFVIPPTNPWRQQLAKLVQSSSFDSIILVLIIVSSILLAIDNPLYDPQSDLVAVLSVIDVVFAALFTLEMVLKILSFGFLCHKNAYLRDGWNFLDFIIVIVSIISIAASGNASLKSLRSLRTLRALRPLRMVAKNKGMRLVVNALFSSLPAIINVLFVCVLFFMIFGIIGVSYFKGAFYQCQGDAFASSPAFVQDLVLNPVPWGSLSNVTQGLMNGTFSPSTVASYQQAIVKGQLTGKRVCLSLGYDWGLTVPSTFDNIFSAMGTLFEMATTEGWVSVMFAGIDSRGEDQHPQVDYSPFWSLFFIAFMVVGNFFVLNLFVGVVIDNFNRMKEKLGVESGQSIFATPEQREWQKTRKYALMIRPYRKEPEPKSPVRRCLFRFVRNQRFEWFIMTCILVNTLTMAMTFYEQPTAYATALEIINYIFAVVFTLEAVLKISALGCQYFSGDLDSSWNMFDFCIVVGTNTGIVLQLALGLNVGAVATVVRTFRVGRIFRLVQRAKKLKFYFSTLIQTLPSLGNIGGLLFLLFFIYAVMGVQLFSEVRLGSTLNEYANFQSFGRAILTLMRCSTGEAWNGIMYDAADQSPGCRNLADIPYAQKAHLCGYNPDPHTCVPIDGCGNPAAFAFFMSFTLFVTFVFLNLFIAVVLESFSDTSEEEAMKLKKEDFSKLADAWLQFDPDATCLIPASSLPQLIQKIPPPLGFDASVTKRETLLRRAIRSLRIQIHKPADAGSDPSGSLMGSRGSGRLQSSSSITSGKNPQNLMVHFADVAQALARRVFDEASKGEGKGGFVPPPVTKGEERELFRLYGRGAMKSATDFDLESYIAASAIEKLFKAYKFRKKIDSRIESNPSPGPPVTGLTAGPARDKGPPAYITHRSRDHMRLPESNPSARSVKGSRPSPRASVPDEANAGATSTEGISRAVAAGARAPVSSLSGRPIAASGQSNRRVATGEGDGQDPGASQPPPVLLPNSHSGGGSPSSRARIVGPPARIAGADEGQDPTE
jgi:hypothetical protein